MKTTSLLRRYIAGLGRHQIFTTRELLGFGSRGAIDTALVRWVNAGLLERLARGVFRLCRSDNRPISVCEIAAVKCRAFGKKIATIGSAELSSRSIANKPEQFVFVTDGSTSSFWFGEKKIVLRGIAPRKLALGESEPGRALRDLWSGRSVLLEGSRVRCQRSLLGRQSQPRIGYLKRFTPEWLSSLFPKAVAVAAKSCKPIQALLSLWLKGQAPFSEWPFRQFSLQMEHFEAVQTIKTLSNNRIQNNKTPILRNQTLTFRDPREADLECSGNTKNIQPFLNGLFNPPSLRFLPPLEPAPEEEATGNEEQNNFIAAYWSSDEANLEELFSKDRSEHWLY